MWPIRAHWCRWILLCLFSNLPALWADAQQTTSGIPTIEVTSRLVFLDVTVLDRKGHSVVNGLTKDDFIITDDKKPQRIFSFEPPESHRVDIGAATDNPRPHAAGHSRDAHPGYDQGFSQNANRARSRSTRRQ